MNLTEMLTRDIEKRAMLKLAKNIPNPTGGKATGGAVKAPKTSPNMADPVNADIPRISVLQGFGTSPIFQPLNPLPGATQSGAPVPPSLPMM